MPKIEFQPSGKQVEIAPGQNLRQVGLDAGVDIPSTCGGVGSCGLCKVKITLGAEHLSPVTDIEKGKLGNVFFITKERLSCQVTASGDVSCLVPDDAAERLAREQKNRDALRQRNLERLRKARS